ERWRDAGAAGAAVGRERFGTEGVLR
ncbi:MAG: hypothetical protein AVDCRST_MAG66-1871, partial [uncultured Pseudonocardia sp.]